MEKLINKYHSLSIRKFFILTVTFTIIIVVILSSFVIGSCFLFRHWLLPDSNGAYLTIEETLSDGSNLKGTFFLEYGKTITENKLVEEYPISENNNDKTVKYQIESIKKTEDMLSPKRKFAYKASGVTMIAAPTLMAFIGIILCSVYFYKKKLKNPVELLSDSVNKIAEQNLDFEISYNCGDEMGALCSSFEKMRQALYKNNREMWNMLEERRLLQASVAHDLRNPIAIIEGYTEYLDSKLKNNEISNEKALHIVHNLNIAAKRLAEYTESVRILNQSEETVLNYENVSALKLAESITEDLMLLTEKSGIVLHMANNLPNVEIKIDSMILYRILENIVNNALRFANSSISIDFSLHDKILSVTVKDDGDGFKQELLNQKEKSLLNVGEDGHMGVGLSMSRLLCKKHGGRLELSNTSYGACVKIYFSV